MGAVSEVELEGELVSSEESMEQRYSYVVHGAQAFCDCGSRMGRLTLPQCHGTYMHDAPIMTIEDTTPQTNVKSFGFCYSLTNPDRVKEVEKVMAKVKEEEKGNILSGIMGGISAIGKGIASLGKKVASVFGYEEAPAPDDIYQGYGKDVFENVMVPCRPEFAIGDTWQGETDRLKINAVNALTTSCTLVCIKGGPCVGSQGPFEEGQSAPPATTGLIQLGDDGQETAAAEQHGKADLADWQPGDPYPEATHGNLEEIGDTIHELELQQHQCTDLNEYQELQDRIDALQKMEGEMSATLDMVDEMTANLAFGAYGEDTPAALEDLNTIKQSFQNGTPVIPVSDEAYNTSINGAYEAAMNGQDPNTYLSANPQEMNYSSFNGQSITDENRNDVPCLYVNGRLVSQSEYNASVTETVNGYMSQQQ